MLYVDDINMEDIIEGYIVNDKKGKRNSINK